VQIGLLDRVVLEHQGNKDHGPVTYLELDAGAESASESESESG
jgi:hypothetical protein